MPRVKHWLLIENLCLFSFRLKQYIILENTFNYDHKWDTILQSIHLWSQRGYYFVIYTSDSIHQSSSNDLNLFLKTSLLCQKALNENISINFFREKYI